MNGAPWRKRVFSEQGSERAAACVRVAPHLGSPMRHGNVDKVGFSPLPCHAVVGGILPARPKGESDYASSGTHRQLDWSCRQPRPLKCWPMRHCALQDRRRPNSARLPLLTSGWRLWAAHPSSSGTHLRSALAYPRVADMGAEAALIGRVKLGARITGGGLAHLELLVVPTTAEYARPQHAHHTSGDAVPTQPLEPGQVPPHVGRMVGGLLNSLVHIARRRDDPTPLMQTRRGGKPVRWHTCRCSRCPPVRAIGRNDTFGPRPRQHLHAKRARKTRSNLRKQRYLEGQRRAALFRNAGVCPSDKSSVA